jgi:molecular chaperone DnaJ
VQRSLLGDIRTSRPCPACHGFGSIISDPCIECGGDGRVRARRSLSVTIPAGVDQGTRIQLAGEGEIGPGGGPAGDLYIEIDVKRHPLFVRKGDQLGCHVTIPMTAAALGTHLDLPTLEADVDREPATVALDIPPGLQSGERLTLRGHGVPRLRGGSRGDLVVEVLVETPTALDDTQRDLLRQLADVRDETAPEARVGPAQKSVLGRIRDALR